MSWEYDNYLQEHIENVQKGFEWLNEHLSILLPQNHSYANITHHDDSKRDREEYNAYDAYFYGGNRSSQVMSNFDYAWLHHIHHNPHHWQYWVLINDDSEEGTKALDIPYPYIIEMICDWWSFSWKTGNLHGIFDWYEDHKDHMILSTKTRVIVESILDKMKEVLDESRGNESV